MMIIIDVKYSLSYYSDYYDNARGVWPDLHRIVFCKDLS